MHDSARVHAFIHPYLKAWELCEDHPRIGDIFSGVLELKTAGDTSTRSLSRQVLFHILQCCPAIHVQGIAKATNGRYAYRSHAGYAAAARVASKAIDRYVSEMPSTGHRLTIKQERALIDFPYDDQLRKLGLI